MSEVEGKKHTSHMKQRSVLITLIAKGSMNTLHRLDIVDAFRRRGVEVSFLVREDYLSLIDKIPDCEYLTCKFPEETGARGGWRHALRYLRSLYWVGAIGRRETTPRETRIFRRLKNQVILMLGRSRLVMRLITLVEPYFYKDEAVLGLDPANIDQILLLGVGGHGAENECKLTWWARQHGISVVNMVGNWDTFTSKGYPGVPIERLLVWGPVMQRDAVERHDIPRDHVTVTGSVKYDGLRATLKEDRLAFLQRLGLAPDRKTILFAGPLSNDLYFEMLKVYETMREMDDGYQMIYRIYPDKALMASAYMNPIIHYAKSLPGIYVSVGDPDYRVGRKDVWVLSVEQHELWHSLEHCDVVVNFFSTIALEACLFDKPVVSMSYRPSKSYAWLHPPEYADHGSLLHNIRLRDYGVVRRTYDREEFTAALREAVREPEKGRAARARAVREELGPLDGKVLERVVDACSTAFSDHRTSMRKNGAVIGAGAAATTT